MKILFLLVALLVFNINFISASTLTEQQAAEDWFNDDSEWRIDEVNEGELKFITPITNKNSDKKVLHSETTLIISEASLQTGWVDMQQCYRNLDAIDKTDVVYNYRNITQLKITSSTYIREAKVVGQSIQLQDVLSAATICVQAKVQILEKKTQGVFALSNGPYYRRFLDGYYPYHVTLNIHYPAEKIKYNQIIPVAQPLLKVVQQPGELLVDTWFEGVLKIDVTFSTN